jgi:signal transduction histidine kinase
MSRSCAMRTHTLRATMAVMDMLGVLRGPVKEPSLRLVAAVVLAVTAAAEASVYAGDPSTAVLFNLFAVSQLVVASRYPRVAALVATLATLVLLADRQAPLTVTGVLALLVVDAYLVVRRGVGLAVLLAIPLALNAVSPLDGSDPGAESFGPLLLVVAALLVGEALRQRGQALDQRDATQLRMAEAMREQTAMEERARIARELHDIVAHHLSMISVQAETARLASPDLPPDGRKRFEEIGGTARDALTEMRRLLGVLREEGEGADRSPQPGLDQLGDLVDSAREAGTNVRLVLRGRAVELPPGVDLTAFRIIQEALTNARRHAPGAEVDVALEYRPDALRLRICDSGPGPTEDRPTPGHGLIGMRDRVMMVGGALSYGPGGGGGFTVEAELPIEEAG